MPAAGYRKFMMSSARVATAFKKDLRVHLMATHENDDEAVDKIMETVSMDELIQTFVKADENESGDIDLKECTKILADLKCAVSQDKLKDLLASLGTGGTLDLRQFLNLMMVVRGIVKGRVVDSEVEKPAGFLHKKCGRAKKTKKRGSLHLRMEVRELGGDLTLSLQVIEGRNLLAKDPSGSSDPYVKATMSLLVPGKKDAPQKTGKVKRSLNPTWNQVLSWVLPAGGIDPAATLLVSVWDWDFLLKDDFMGCMSFPLSALVAARVTEGWFLLLDDQQGLRHYFRDLSGGMLHQPPVPSPTHTSPAPQKKHSAADYSILKLLGRGGFSKTFLAQHVTTHAYVALKCVKKTLFLEEEEPAEAMAAIWAEEHVLSFTPRSPFVVHALAAFQTPACLFFVMELAGGGDLLHVVTAHGRLTAPQAAFYIAETTLGLEYLHKHGIVHRDVKPENVLLALDGHVKLADFGSVKEHAHDTPATSFVGTHKYMAPEVFKREPYSFAVDWWALGVLAHDLLMGRALFDGDTEEDLYQAVVEEPPRFPKSLPPDADDFLRKLVQPDPLLRLGARGAGDVRAHAFLVGGVAWPALEARTAVPPFLPKEQSAARADANFDPDVTSAAPAISPIKRSNLQKIPQELFVGFSYVDDAA